MLGPISRRRDGTFRIKLREEQRDLIRALVPQLREMILQRDETAWRLFPNPYADDPLQALQYEEMLGDDLQSKRLAALKTLEDTAGAESLAEDELHGWMTAINDIRLVLGTRLDVTEESEWDDYETELESALFSAYSYLGWLMENIVQTLMSSPDFLDG